MTYKIKRHIKTKLSVCFFITVVSLVITVLAASTQADMVAFFDFEDNGPGTTTDNVGSYVGTLETIGAGNLPTLVPSIDASYGSAYSFDGTGFIDGTDDPSFQVAQGTVMAWFNASANDGESQIAGIPAGDTWSAPYLGLHNYRGTGSGGSNDLGAQANVNGAQVNLVGGPSPGIGSWHHIASVYDGNDLKLYVDGSLALTSPQHTGSIQYTGTPSLTIAVSAGDGTGNPFKGLVDEVKLFNTALSEAEIMTEMQPSGPVTPATDFEWQADEFGNWASQSSWSFSGVPSPGVANSPGHSAIFADAISTDTSAVTTADVTVNRIEFNNATHSYNISGHGSVNLAATTEAAPTNPTITVLGNHQFQAVVNLLADTSVNVGITSTLSFNNELNLMGSTLTKTGDGTVAVNNKLTTAGGSLSLQQGTVSGYGTIGGGLINNGGTVSPGDGAGGANVVPEPASLWLVLLGMLGIVVSRRRRTCCADRITS